MCTYCVCMCTECICAECVLYMHRVYTCAECVSVLSVHCMCTKCTHVLNVYMSCVCMHLTHLFLVFPNQMPSNLQESDLEEQPGASASLGCSQH